MRDRLLRGGVKESSSEMRDRPEKRGYRKVSDIQVGPSELMEAWLVGSHDDASAVLPFNTRLTRCECAKFDLTKKFSS